MTAPAPRPEVAGIAAVPHGAIGDAELAALGLTYADVIDFSVNSNPLGPSPAVRRALASVDPSRYPDDDCRELRGLLAARAGVEPDAVIVGNGSSELLWLVALGWLRPGDSLLALVPTFGEYDRAARLMGTRIDPVRADAGRDFRPDLDAVAAAIRATRPRVVYLGNPNNPTGTYLEPAAVRALAAAAPDTLFVVDEAYLAFVAGDAAELARPLWGAAVGGEAGNVLLLRSLTKDYALAGLRLGYALAAPAVIGALRTVQPPWSVSAAAQAAGLAAIGDEAHLRAARAEVERARAVVEAGLGRLGLRVVPSACNFVLVAVGDARAARAALLRRRCVVRDCTSFGLPGHIRVGLRTGAECAVLVAACAEAIAAGDPALRG